jgi:hypothetical protein
VTWDLATDDGPYTTAQRDLLICPWVEVCGLPDGLIEREEAAMNEVPTYQPLDGVNGPTLGRDLPDGCERLQASYNPSLPLAWIPPTSPGIGPGRLYWWRFPPLKVGDRVQLTGTVGAVAPSGVTANVKIDNGGDYGFPTAALTRVVTP